MKRKLTGAAVLSIAGIVAACVSVVGGFLGSARVCGAAGAVMLIGNVIALYVEASKDQR